MIYLCAISNISSGNCSEDCKFCTQSAHYNTNINTYKEKSIDEIINEAKIAKQNRAVGFCLVTSGKGLNDKKLEYICKVAYEVKKEVDISLKYLFHNLLISLFYHLFILFPQVCSYPSIKITNFIFFFKTF